MRNKCKSVGSSAILVVLVLFYSTAFADIMRELSICEMTQGAEKIIIGTVEAVRPKYSADGTTINTHVLISPSKYVAGDSVDNFIVVEVEGGRVGEMLLYVASSPVFEEGEEVLVFLRFDSETENKAERLVGWAQGKFSIYYDEQTAQFRVTRNLEGITIIPGHGITVPETLNELRAQIHGCLP